MVQSLLSACLEVEKKLHCSFPPRESTASDLEAPPASGPSPSVLTCLLLPVNPNVTIAIFFLWSTITDVISPASLSLSGQAEAF